MSFVDSDWILIIIIPLSYNGVFDPAIFCARDIYSWLIRLYMYITLCLLLLDKIWLLYYLGQN